MVAMSVATSEAWLAFDKGGHVAFIIISRIKPRTGLVHVMESIFEQRSPIGHGKGKEGPLKIFSIRTEPDDWMLR